MTRPLRILFANHRLSVHDGTSTYTRDLAGELLRRGHRPMAFSTELGQVADELRRMSIPVTGDLDAIRERPDVIHGQQGLEMIAALLRFRDVPSVFMAHDAQAPHAAAPNFPRVLRYVAVDEACRDRLVMSEGIDAARVQLLYNAVNLDRFTRRPPLPARPSRALVFSNGARPGGFQECAIQACTAAGLHVDVMGLGSGNAVADPERALREYDIVFAKARAAQEALATGNAVILCDELGFGPMVTLDRFDELRAMNFGRRALRHPISRVSIERELENYDPTDAGLVTTRMRDVGSLRTLADHFEVLYGEMVAEKLPKRDEAAPIARYLTGLRPLLFEPRIEYIDREVPGPVVEVPGPVVEVQVPVPGPVVEVAVPGPVIEVRLAPTRLEAIRALLPKRAGDAIWTSRLRVVLRPLARRLSRRS